VGSTIGGAASAIRVREGSRVRSGDVIVEFDAAQQVAAYRGALASARSALAALADLAAGTRAPDLARAQALARQQAQTYESASLSASNQIAQLDNQIRQADANIATARAATRDARINALREITLFATGDVSAQARDAAVSRAKQTQGQLAAASAVASSARSQRDNAAAVTIPHTTAAALEGYRAARLELMTVRSPAAGVVTALNLHVGDLVAAGAAVATIDENGEPFVRVYVPQSQLAPLESRRCRHGSPRLRSRQHRLRHGGSRRCASAVYAVKRSDDRRPSRPFVRRESAHPRSRSAAPRRHDGARRPTVSAGAAIGLRNISKSYGSHAVVNRLSLQVSRGEIFGFLGPNGSGKSTTIKMLCGLVKPSGGSATICGLDVATQGDAVRRTIGYMSQSFSLYDDLTVEENLEFYGRAYRLSKAKREERIDEMIRFSELTPYRKQLAGTLSGGWKQRLALAGALLHEPAVLFLDEPTAGIDPVARRDLWDLLFTLSERGVALFVTTHYMDEAERCGRVGYIWNGELIALGTRDELRHLPDVTPAGTTRFEAGGRDVVAMLVAARKLHYVRDATIFGSGLHLLVDAETAERRIAVDLAVPASEVAPIEPSLEDVFVALTRAQRA